ncbi:hypothetical protein [Embleya scabrispora]|uniref:hypothetical protein n=1 Tax=Embleya scabrispora TaxID=159449 RepID=UPI0003678FBE|nr:hypothetical protein [Embleya scabrispora]MYS82724.1 hypothetical protein [Streptomyces sp. SID5474]
MLPHLVPARRKPDVPAGDIAEPPAEFLRFAVGYPGRPLVGWVEGIDEPRNPMLARTAAPGSIRPRPRPHLAVRARRLADRCESRPAVSAGAGG